MKNRPVRITAIIVSVIVAVVVAYLLYISLASGRSRTDGETSQAHLYQTLAARQATLSETSAAVMAMLTARSAATQDSSNPATPLPAPMIEVPESSRFYVYSDEVNAIEGELVEEGPSAYPDVVANVHIKSYRITKLDLPDPVAFTIDGEPGETGVVWRLAVKGGQFTTGAQSWMIWLEDVPLGRGIPYTTSQIAVIIVSESQLRPGAMIFVSYGEGPPHIPVAELKLDSPSP